jgi:chromate transporter
LKQGLLKFLTVVFNKRAGGYRPNPPSPISLWQASRYWPKLGSISFDVPAGQIALMHRHLVEHTRSISDGRFLHALKFCMLLPGPEAQQLATSIGWLMHLSGEGLLQVACSCCRLFSCGQR